MALIPFPTSPIPAEVKWSLKQPTQVNRSEWTGRRKVTVLAGAPRWTALVTLPPILGEPAVAPWRAFLAACMGQAQSFRLVACENQQIAGVAPLVNGGSQIGYGIATDGWGAAGLKLRAGQFVTIADQLLQLTTDVVANGAGQAVVEFRPAIRVSLADNAPITADWPYALMSMSDDDNGWTVGRGQQYAIQFACEESF